MSDPQPTTLNMIIAALGGEGGGVLAGWIESVALEEKWLCQTTYLAGVAQRTGATIYYLELFPAEKSTDTKPVMALFPSQGDIDIAIASEIVEAGRMIQRGFITPDRTTLIASDHRVYSINEKIDLGDGTIESSGLTKLAKSSSKQFIHYDMLQLSREHDTVISATLLGALAGSGALPFKLENYEKIIQESKVGVEQNLAAFRASVKKTHAEDEPDPVESQATGSYNMPEGTTLKGKALIDRAKKLPPELHQHVYLGLEKLVDYQDFDYAGQYLDRLEDCVSMDTSDRSYQLCNELARYLSLWMCFEDIVRVAQIKTRNKRMMNVREEVKADTDQIVYATEYFKPQIEEICSYMPPKLAEAVMGSGLCRKFMGLFTGGKQIRTNTIMPFLMLYSLTYLKGLRRYSWIYHREHELINQWLNNIKSMLESDYDAALELVECGRLIKGYSKTRQRGYQQLKTILDKVEQNNITDPNAIKAWRDAAMEDDENIAFNKAIPV